MSQSSEIKKKNNGLKPIFEPHEDFPERRICMLLVTHSCNLKCSYCYETHKDSMMMSLDMAIDIIRKEVKYVQDNPKFSELQIDFMGGEPLMNYELIKQIVELLERNPLPIPFICFATTNGTLLTPERKEWFQKHHDSIWLGASYDGTPESQRQNRGLESQHVDYDFFYNTWPLQGFKMTISQESLPYLAEGILKAQRKGYIIGASLAQGISWNDDDAIMFYKQLQILSDAYLDDETLQPINLLNSLLYGLALDEVQQSRFCGSGFGMITYDIDGQSYPCHMFAPITLGVDKALTFKDFICNAHNISDPFCENCCLKHICPTCIGFNYRYRGSLSKRDTRWCKMILAQAMVACEFQIKAVAKRRDSLTEKEAQYVKAAMEAYPILCKFSVPQSTSPFVK